MKFKALSIALLAPVIALSACNGTDDSGGTILGRDEVTGPVAQIPDGVPTATPNPDSNPSTRLGSTCHTNDPNHICLALKYVVYENSSGAAVATQAEALDNLTQVNSIWSQCDIGFEIGEYVATDPTQYGLNYGTSTTSELTKIRSQYQNTTELLVVSTGTWTGTLGAGAANAWTSMPGGGPYGVVLEAPVATYPNIIAHELGHYLNLDHISDTTDVMNPVIGTNSVKLTTAQCTAARSAAQYFWSAMVR